ncbi:hypothetical protein MES4922_170145 [Mesorhizobium ventifaucium]|uniref:Twin-arginine translocation signal domain-containing protein n=1 Tax=Mesorhizobium ventifaucium TaxID=666020 RepID=A0ABN8JFD4_9HYPH|nr:hypothetical protein MES4922_170145 [Mesorhizobium ventifaucium]
MVSVRLGAVPQPAQCQEFAMFRINRRTLILNSASAVIASTVVGTAVAREPQRRNSDGTRYHPASCGH